MTLDTRRLTPDAQHAQLSARESRHAALSVRPLHLARQAIPALCDRSPQLAKALFSLDSSTFGGLVQQLLALLKLWLHCWFFSLSGPRLWLTRIRGSMANCCVRSGWQALNPIEH